MDKNKKKQFMLFTPETMHVREHVVAPHVGAWIETSHNGGQCRSDNVAPHVGA